MDERIDSYRLVWENPVCQREVSVSMTSKTLFTETVVPLLKDVEDDNIILVKE